MKFDMDSKCSGTNEQDKDYVLRSPPNSNGISIRKRAKLQEKALDELILVDPPFVPKKLRSALTRRNCQWTQPSQSDSKRNQRHDFQGTKMLQDTTEEFNEVEKEVAEFLISISSYFTGGNSAKSNDQVMKKLEEKSEIKAPLSSFPPLEVVKEQNTVEKRNMIDHTTQKTTKPELLLKSEESVMNLSKQTGCAHQYLPLNGCRMSQPTQLESCSVQKQELGVNPVEHKLQTLKPKNGSLMYDVYGKDAHGLQLALQSRGHEKMSMISTSNTVSCPDAVLGRPVIGGMDLNALPEKLSPVSTDRKRPWNRCMTHVYISHLVKDNQKKEMKLPMLHDDNQLKTKNEAFNFTSTAINGSRSDMIHPPGISLLNRNNSEEARNHVHGYDPQKQDSENLGKLLAPFPPNQGVLPYKFSPVPYPSLYQEQLPNASNQQVQLQHLPHFLTNSQLQQQQIQQQQLFWQAHMAQFRQNGMQHSSSSSTATLANNSQPSIFSFMPNFNPHLHQQFAPLPSPSLSSRLNQNQMISNAESYR